MNTNLLKWSAVLMVSAIAISCEDDVITEHNNSGSKTTVQFESAAETIAENASERTVMIKFSKPLVLDAELLTLKADDAFAENFTTVPALENGVINIQLAKGATGAAIKVTPIDNSEKDGNRVANIKIQSFSLPFMTGTSGALNITITDDEGDSLAQSLANFIQQSITLDETATSWIEYQVHFSEAVAVESEVKVSIAAEKGAYGVDFTSEPIARDNIVALHIVPGSRVISFRVRPLDNDKITGNLSVNLLITETSGSIRKGNKLHEVLTITDDELAGKPKGYEVTAGTDIIKRFYEYDEHGRVAKVRWENYTPYLTQGTESYHYDGSNQIARIEKHPGREILYHWANGRITKSETIQDGVLHAYNEYAYDDAGNVGGVVSYHRQGDGSFAKGMYTVHLYFTDGNLFKSLTYQDSDDPQNPALVSTRTYDNYMQVDNPFPMTEVLPNVRMQKTLPTTYRVEDATGDLLYHMTYEFREDGQPEKRIAISGSDVQTAVYHYY